MATLIAFYDANVLYPAELRNFLMHLALTGLFRAKWSNAVHEEWSVQLRSKVRMPESDCHVWEMLNLATRDKDSSV
jgi:hypothetical protein